jgi:DUF4097 and DUF4098 domain-containing protein YvlB
MTFGRNSRIVKAVVACAVSAMFVISCWAETPDRKGSFSEEFHKVYPLSAQGRIELENINGPVHITGWDRNEVKVDAVKTAWTKERLDEAAIQVDAGANSISIRTEYPHHDRTFNFDNDEERNNPARVEYTITVPRQARLDEIKLVNGRLDVQDVSGDVRASCVNGRITAGNLRGHIELNTVNGGLDASINELAASEMRLSSVNGKLRLTLPSDVKAELKASTVSGNISDEFGLPVTRHQYVGHTLHGQLGGGGTLVKLSNVNGTIEIRHASDNRPLSPAQNLERESNRNRDNDRDEDDDDDI